MRLLLLTLLLLTQLAPAQNLVPNPSFEEYVSCPDDIGQLYLAQRWATYTNIPTLSDSSTPDFCTRCAINPIAGVPDNALGHQEPHSGDSYAGMWCYVTNTFYREIIGARLIQPLVVGQKYYVKFHANLSLRYWDTNANSATNKIGLKFTNTDYSISPSMGMVNNTAHLLLNGFITDTLNWTTVFGTFVADSTYNFVMLGNFYDNANTPLIRYGGSPDSNAYYFVDDVCVSTDSLYTLNYTRVETYSAENILKIYPNPVSDVLIIENSFTNNHELMIYMFNAVGQKVLERTIQTNEPVPIDMSGFQRGVMLLQIEKNHKRYYFKIFKT